MKQHLQQPKTPVTVGASTEPSRDLPVNDPPPSDDSQPPVQDPTLPHPDPNLRNKEPPGRHRTDPDTAEPAAAIDADWADDPNPEAHESAV